MTQLMYGSNCKSRYKYKSQSPPNFVQERPQMIWLPNDRTGYGDYYFANCAKYAVKNKKMASITKAIRTKTNFRSHRTVWFQFLRVCSHCPRGANKPKTASKHHTAVHIALHNLTNISAHGWLLQVFHNGANYFANATYAEKKAKIEKTAIMTKAFRTKTHPEHHKEKNTTKHIFAHG